MNYRHAFHAGNFGDVLKHALLARILGHLALKDTPFRVLDIHAGAGRYDLASEQAARTGEWRAGIGRLIGRDLGGPAEAVLAPYRAEIARLNPQGGLRWYPGSPELALGLSRAGDRVLLVEKHPDTAAALREQYRRARRIKVVELDGWTALTAYVPPPERRGVVLVDPPFEDAGEFARMRAGLSAAHRKWPSGVYALWYPIKDLLAIEAFARELKGLGIPRMLRAELLVRAPRDPSILNGCGLIVVNPPYTLEGDCRALLPALAAALGQGDGARGRVEWIAGEGPPAGLRSDN